MLRLRWLRILAMKVRLMIKERIYAVVDLETTGPKQDGSDK